MEFPPDINYPVNALPVTTITYVRPEAVPVLVRTSLYDPWAVDNILLISTIIRSYYTYSGGYAGFTARVCRHPEQRTPPPTKQQILQLISKEYGV